MEQATRMGLRLVPSIGYGCSDSSEGCNPSRLFPGETFRDLIVNASSKTRAMLWAYATDMVTR